MNNRFFLQANGKWFTCSHTKKSSKNNRIKQFTSQKWFRYQLKQNYYRNHIQLMFYYLNRVLCVCFVRALIILLSLCHYNNRILTSIRWSVNDLQHPNRFVPLLYNIRCDKTFLLITFSLAVSMLSFYCVSLFVSSKTFFTIHRYLLLQLMVVKLDWLLLVLFKWIALNN